jgi:glucose dehydrogenase
MDSDAEKELAVCLDAADGRELWRTPIGRKFLDDLGNGPRSTPTVADGVVYVLGAHGVLAALDAGDGRKVWEVDLPAVFGSKVPNWGYSASPLVDGDLVLLEVGGSPARALVAFDRGTGAVRWSLGDGEAAYSSPVAMTLGGIRQYVFARRTGSEVVAVSPAGKELWRHPAPATMITMPLFVAPDKVYLSSGDDAGAMLLRVRGSEGKLVAEEIWKSRLMKNHFNGAVQVGEFLYGFDNGTFKCLSLSTGQQRWAQRGLGKGSLVAGDGLLFVLSDRGTLVLVEANPDTYTEKARFQALSGKTWTSPTLAGGRLYLRGMSEVVALDVRAAEAGGAS